VILHPRCDRVVHDSKLVGPAGIEPAPGLETHLEMAQGTAHYYTVLEIRFSQEGAPRCIETQNEQPPKQPPPSAVENIQLAAAEQLTLSLRGRPCI